MQSTNQKHVTYSLWSICESFTCPSTNYLFYIVYKKNKCFLNSSPLSHGGFRTRLKKVKVQVTAVNAQKSLYSIIIRFLGRCNGSSFNKITQGALLIFRRYYVAEWLFGSQCKVQASNSQHEIVIKLVSEHGQQNPIKTICKENFSATNLMWQNYAQHKYLMRPQDITSYFGKWEIFLPGETASLYQYLATKCFEFCYHGQRSTVSEKSCEKC